MADVRFEWDPVKAKANLVKHGIAFEEATTVFGDEFAVWTLDAASSQDEERWIMTGNSSRERLLVVIHTYLEISASAKVVRIISARRASRNERRQYEQ